MCATCTRDGLLMNETSIWFKDVLGSLHKHNNLPQIQPNAISAYEGEHYTPKRRTMEPPQTMPNNPPNPGHSAERAIAALTQPGLELMRVARVEGHRIWSMVIHGVFSSYFGFQGPKVICDCPWKGCAR